MSLDLKAWMQAHLERVESALSTGIVAESPAALGQAMRYAVLDGGKRLRPCWCWPPPRRWVMT